MGYKLIVQLGELLSDISQVWSLMDTAPGGSLSEQVKVVSYLA